MGVYWSEDRIYAALVNFLVEFDLPLTSARYRELRKGRVDFPSHQTVRNRCGLWWHVRLVTEKMYAERQVPKEDQEEE